MIEQFLFTVGESPFVAMWYLFLNGGWIALVWALWWGATNLWLEYRQTLYNQNKQWMLLAISVPRLTEQTPRAVENIFAHLAGIHASQSWKEKWIEGKTQDQISLEIVSVDGHVQFMMFTTRNFRDLIEASVYAQYPDAEIVEVEDYTLKVPSRYPDPEWEAFGTEMIPVKSDVYPLRTYPEFEDKVSGEFKDPLAVLLENMSRLGPGEQFWYQIVITAIEQNAFRKKGEILVKKISGQKVEIKPKWWEQVLGLPFTILGVLLQEAFGGTSTAPKKPENPFATRMLQLTPGERKVLEGIENKISKIAYMCKIRFMYIGKKEVFKKSRIVHPFIGAMKQFNTNDMQSIKPEGKKVGVNSTLWFFKARRNNERKMKLVRAYRGRSNWAGVPNFTMNIEELATLWHFPITGQSKPPQLIKTEAKRSEPPMNLPFG